MNIGVEKHLRLLSSWERPGDRSTASGKGRLARALLRFSAANSGNFPGAAAWKFIQTPSGQPRLDVAGVTPGISFTHSGDWIGCALNSDGPVGVDLEMHRPGRDLAGIAKVAFSTQEVQRGLTNAEEFYRIWCVREAIAKATGVGLAQATNRQDYAASGPLVGSWQTGMADQIWDLFHMTPASGVSLASAAPAGQHGVPAQPELTITV